MNIPNNAFFRKRVFKPFRITLGAVFVLFGAFGFLPIVGYWMVPMGIAILAIDLPWANRLWTRMVRVYADVSGRIRKRFPNLRLLKILLPEPREETQSES